MHPGIARVYAVGLDPAPGEPPWIAMELVSGSSILDHARGAALGLVADPSEVRLVGADTAAPLWSPDPDTRRPRFVVTSTLTVQAVGI